MSEVVEEGNDVTTTGMGWVGFDDSLKEFDFVESCFRVVRGGLYDFESDVLVDSVREERGKKKIV